MQQRPDLAERRVATSLVIEHLDVIKQLHLRVAVAVEVLAELALDRREEAFRHGVDAPICQDCRGGALGGLEVCCAQPVILDKGVVDLSSDESLQATDNVFLRQPLGGAAGDVINGRLVPAHADDHDSIERRVGLPVASAEQPVPVRDSARGWYRTGAAEFRKRGVGPGRCCMKTRCGWGGLARTFRDPS